jgi:acetyl esterase/lipase
MLAIDALRLCGKWWAAEDDLLLPRLSPLYADLKDLPPIDMYQGSDDVLVVDARTFAAKARQAGNLVHYSEVRGAFHVFMGATFTPEAKAVFAHIASSLSDAATASVPEAPSTSA